VYYSFERLVEPLDKTETKKSQTRIDKGEQTEHTQWKVSEPVLRSLKAKGKAKEIISIILEYSKIDKLRGTYLEGYTKLIDEMDWEKDMLHTSFNQCVAVTGRLSSSKPNMQNADKITKKFMESRYDHPGGY
jgi:DNA polymerase-1